MNRQVLVLCLALFVAVLACGPLADAGTPTPPPDLIATEVVRQRAVAATLTAEAAPKASPVVVVVTATPPPATTIPPTAPPTAPPPPTVIPPTAVPTATPLPPPTVKPTIAPSQMRNMQAADSSFQGAQRVHIIVEYSYNGEWGADNVYISATAWNDKAQITEIYADRQPVHPGYDVSELDLILHERGTYITSRIQMCLFAEGSVPRLVCQFWPYAKTWKQ